MSTETELHRLVVRLMGDGTDFRNMLDKAITEGVTAVRRMENEAKKVEAANEKALGEAANLTRAAMTPLQRYNEQLVMLNEHLAAGRITQETFNYHTQQAAASLAAAGNQVTEFASQMRNLGFQAAIVGGALAGFSGMVIKSGTMAAGQFEQTNIAFEVMIGNAAESQKLLADLTTFAAETPFEMPQIEAAARGLVQFGERGDELMETLNMLGNAASATNSDFGMVGMIFNQIRGVGKLLTQDFRQLSSRGILSLQDLANHFKTTTEGAQEMLSEGKISFEDVREIFKELSAEGGRFGNMMEKQSKSLLGMLSTLKDNLNLTKRSIGDYFIAPAKEAVKWLNVWAGSLQASDGWVKTFMASVLGLGFGLGTLITTVGSLAMAAGQAAMMYNNLTQLVKLATIAQWAYNAAALAAQAALVGLAIYGVYLLYQKIRESTPYMKQFREELAGIGKEAEKTLVDLGKWQEVTMMRIGLTQGGKERSEAINQAGGEAMRRWAEVEKKIIGYQALIDKINRRGETGELWANAEDSLKKLQEAMAGAVKEGKSLEDFVKGLTSQAGELDKAGMATPEDIEAADQLLKTLEFQVKTMRMSVDQAEQLKLAEQNISSEKMAQIQADRDILALNKRAVEVEAERNAQKAEKEAEVTNIKEYIKALEDEIKTIGMSTEQLIAHKFAKVSDTEEMRKYVATVKDLEATKMGKALEEKYMPATEKFAKRQKELRDLLDRDKMSWETYGKAVEDAAKSLNRYNQEVNTGVTAFSSEYYKILMDMQNERTSRVSLGPKPEAAAAPVPIALAGLEGPIVDMSISETHLARIVELLEREPTTSITVTPVNA